MKKQSPARSKSLKTPYESNSPPLRLSLIKALCKYYCTLGEIDALKTKAQKKSKKKTSNRASSSPEKTGVNFGLSYNQFINDLLPYSEPLVGGSRLEELKHLMKVELELLQTQTGNPVDLSGQDYGESSMGYVGIESHLGKNAGKHLRCTASGLAEPKISEYRQDLSSVLRNLGGGDETDIDLEHLQKHLLSLEVTKNYYLKNAGDKSSLDWQQRKGKQNRRMQYAANLRHGSMSSYENSKKFNRHFVDPNILNFANEFLGSDPKFVTKSVTSVDKPSGTDKAKDRASSRSLKVQNNNNASYSSLGKAPSQSKKFAPLNPIITAASRGEIPPPKKIERPTKSSSLQPMPRLLVPPRDSEIKSKPKFKLPDFNTLKYSSNTDRPNFTTGEVNATIGKCDSQRNYQSNQEPYLTSPRPMVDNYLSANNYQSTKKSAYSDSKSDTQLDITNITIKEGLGSSLVDHRNRNACLALGGMFKPQADGKVIPQARFFGIGERLDSTYILVSIGGLFKREDGKTKYFIIEKGQKFFG